MTAPVSDRVRVKRGPKRACYEQETLYQILDDAFVCHIGGMMNDYPCVQPNLHWRIGNRLYLHGSIKNGLISGILASGQCCVTVTLFDGLVLARSAFHHSVNYRSVMLYGKPVLIEDPAEKTAALDALVEKCQQGRASQVRAPNDIELKATAVIAIDIEEASAKVRTGGPIDDPEDMDWPVWAGVIPAQLVFGEPEQDSPA